MVLNPYHFIPCVIAVMVTYDDRLPWLDPLRIRYRGVTDWIPKPLLFEPFARSALHPRFLTFLAASCMMAAKCIGSGANSDVLERA
jgi:hypothetical protein